MATYDAFISYSHAKDKPVAAALQSVVQKLGKPWHQRRALRVFRDDTSLSATPGLWPSIERALAQSRYLILLASPDAAASPWIAKEVAYWLEHKSADTLLIALTDGELGWDNAAGDFIWREAVPLPAVLAGRFSSEPKWVDLRAYRAGASTSDARFTELAADFAAAIHGLPKDDLLSQEVRQQRRALTLAWSAVGLLLMLVVFAGWQWNTAVRSERLAIAEAARAERNFAAAKETIDSVVLDLTQGLQDVASMRLETLQRILARAENAVEKLASRTENSPEIRVSQASMYSLFADTYSRSGNHPLATDYVRKSIDIWRELVASRNDPWLLRDFAITLQKLGYLLRANGDLGGSLAAYREQLEIMRSLADQQPDNAQWQHGIALALEGVGTVFVIQREFKNALAAYREALDVSRTLVAQEPNNSSWSGTLSASLMSLGSVLMAQEQFANALPVYHEANEIHRKLVADDPDSAAGRRLLSLSLAAIGRTLKAQGDINGSLISYSEALALVRSLSDKDPENRMWRSELSISLADIGDLLVAHGRFQEAIATLRENANIMRALVAGEPDREGWRLGLRLALSKLANALRTAGDFNGAIVAYREDIEIVRASISQAPSNSEAKIGLSVALNVLGNALFARGDFKDALASYQESLGVMRELTAKDPSNMQWQLDTIVPLLGLAAGGNDHSGRVTEALAILDRVKAQGNHSPQQLKYIQALETDTNKLTPAGPNGVPTEQVQGHYQGTHTVAAPGDTRLTTTHISIAVEQAGRYLSAAYQTSLGGTGKGIGIITGSSATLSLRSETASCPGAYTAAFTFLRDSVSWTYSGQDCSGPVQGRGIATRTKQ